ncbi:hypothetical protein SteCoe_12676 [Stentor coeruleus]|uniref:Uncharacterized protein n=1 Tax=Stentor coeruleus TaxID=5963 RepID=A0A1R2CA76_9CILI|nr:hypothetical protein SteCoe_12676 [Stentor coeruleus]
MLNLDEFATDDMKSVVDRIMKAMNGDSDLDTSQSTVTCSSSYIGKSKPLTPEPARSRESLKRDASPKMSTMKKTPLQQDSVIVSNSANFETVYARMLAFQKRHDQEIKKLQERNEENHRQTHTHTPTLNEKTRSMVGHTSPIHSRYQQEIQLKEKHRKDLFTKIETMKEEKLAKELTFKPNTTRSSSNVRSVEEYYNYMMSWKQNRDKIEKDEREAQADKVLEGVTFKPVLNKTSATMAKNLPKFEERVERGIQMRDAKIREKKSVSPCSFKPELQTKYKKVELGPVFDRLYPQNIKMLSARNKNEED